MNGSAVPLYVDHTTLLSAIREENIPALLAEHTERIIEEVKRQRYNDCLNTGEPLIEVYLDEAISAARKSAKSV